MTGRTVPEWKGKTPDSKVPPRVRARIFLAHDGICFLTKHKIAPADQWDLDHKTALCNGGLHVESNLVPVLRAPHRIKTISDVKAKAKSDRIRKRHLGIKKPRSIRAWRRFDGTPVYASRER